MLLDGQVCVALVEEEVFEDVIGSGQRLFDVAEFEGHGFVDVSLIAIVVNARLGRGERFERIGDRGQHFVLDVDEIERSRGLILRARDHRGDRVSDHPHLVAAERLFILTDGEDAVANREIGPREDGVHPWRLRGPLDADAAQERMRIAGAQQLAMEHAGKEEVVGEACLAEHLGAPVNATARLSDHVEVALHGRFSAISAAARSTASKIWM